MEDGSYFEKEDLAFIYYCRVEQHRMEDLYIERNEGNRTYHS